MLKLQIDGNENEKIQVLQSMLDDLKEQKNDLETENRYFSHLVKNQQLGLLFSSPL